MLGDAQAVVDGRVRSGGVHACSGTHFRGGHTGDAFKGFGRVLWLGDEFAPFIEALVVATLRHIVFGHQAFSDHHMGQRCDERHIRAGLQSQVVLGFHMRAADQVNLARVGDDQFRALTQTTFHARGKHRVGV